MARGAAILALLAMAAIARAEPPVALCQQYAQTQAHHQGAGGILKGGVVGAGVGAMVGSFFGGAGTGAAIGGSLGAIGSGSRKRNEFNDAYVEAFTDCMAGVVTPPH